MTTRSKEAGKKARARIKGKKSESLPDAECPKLFAVVEVESRCVLARGMEEARARGFLKAYNEGASQAEIVPERVAWCSAEALTRPAATVNWYVDIMGPDDIEFAENVYIGPFAEASAIANRLAEAITALVEYGLPERELSVRMGVYEIVKGGAS